MRCTVLLAPGGSAEGHDSPIAAGLSPAATGAAPARGLTAAITRPAPAWPLLLGALLALLATALLPTPALAASKSWTGFGDGANWSSPGNWDTGTAPVNGDDLVFPLGVGHVTNNDIVGLSLHSIVIAAGGFTLNGNAVTITGDPGIQANYGHGATSTINLAVSANGTHIDVVQTDSRLVFGGSLTSNGSLVKVGTGTAALQAPGNAQDDGWLISAGILNVQNGAALGGAVVGVFPGGTLQVQGGITISSSMSLRGTGAPNATGAVESVSGNNTLTGTIELLNSSTITADSGATLMLSTNPVQLLNTTLTAGGAGGVSIASPIQFTGGLTKTGIGVLALSGSNTYTGPTTVTAGTLLVNGSQPGSPVTVASGATLGGTGTTGPVTVNGIINPGVGGPGILHSGNVTFNAGSALALELNGTTVGGGYDQLFAAGTVTLTGPTLTVAVGFPSAPGNTFAIIQSTGAVNGGFSGLPEGFTFTSGGRTFRINYTPNAVTLTDVTPAATNTPTPTATLTPLPTATGTIPTVTPTVTSTTTCILGDINCDGIVDIRDYGLWRQAFGQPGAGNRADLNQDGIVDIRDYGLWRQHFGESTPPDRRSGGPLPAGRVPAPGSGVLLRAEDSELPVPVIPLVGGLVGWRTRRSPGTE
jgi:autotransporter-associated beta strand protein